MNRIRGCAVAMAVLAAALTTPAVQAVCGGTGFTIFSGTFHANPLAGCDTPTLQANIERAWWRFVNGNPVIGAGDDNGAYEDWIFYAGACGSFGIFGETEAGPTDGCPDQGGTLVAAVCDPGGKWALATTLFDFTLNAFYFAPSGAVLSPTPGVVVTGTTRLSATSHRIFFTAPPISGGPNALDQAFYPGTGTSIPASAAISGVQLFTKTVPRDEPIDGDHRIASGGWTDTGVRVAPGAAGQVDITCATDSDTYLGVAPVFEGATPFRSGCVSTMPRLVQCGPTLAEPPGRFHLMEKPKPRRR